MVCLVVKIFTGDKMDCCYLEIEKGLFTISSHLVYDSGKGWMMSAYGLEECSLGRTHDISGLSIAR